MYYTIQSAFICLLFVGSCLGQSAQDLVEGMENPSLKGIDGVGISSQAALPVMPAVGWYYVARGEASKAVSATKRYHRWREAILDVIKAEIAKSDLALETTESQLSRSLDNEEYASSSLNPVIEVHKGWYRARIKLDQTVQLPNGQWAGNNIVTYETEPSIGKLGENPKDTVVEVIRGEVREFIQDWKAKQQGGKRR